MENWKDIEGYEGLYQVSTHGRVRSLKRNKIMNPVKAINGYMRVRLIKNGKDKNYLVHRLVAEAFLPNWFDDPQVNHRDENKQNNHVDNLEWCSAKYNTNYGSCIKRRVEKLSKPVLQFLKTGEFVREWVSIQEVERQLGVCHSKISLCCKGKRKSHHGFIWRYKDI